MKFKGIAMFFQMRDTEPLKRLGRFVLVLFSGTEPFIANKN